MPARPVAPPTLQLCLYFRCPDRFSKSEVEETLERIKVQPGVEGYVICDMEGQVKVSFAPGNRKRRYQCLRNVKLAYEDEVN